MNDEYKNDFIYKVKTENADPKASVIEKSNVKVEFTAYDLEANERSFRKLLKECQAQKQLADASMSNIETNHPFVKDMSEKDCFTVHMYQEQRAMSRVCGSKIPEIERELAYIEAEKKEVEKQIGIAIPASSFDEPKPETPAEPAPEAPAPQA